MTLGKEEKMPTNEEIDYCVDQAISIMHDPLHQDLYRSKIHLYRTAVLFIMEGPPQTTLNSAVNRMIEENLVPDLVQRYKEFCEKQSLVKKIFRNFILSLGNPKLTKLVL